MKKKVALLTFFLLFTVWMAGCKSESSVFDGNVSSYNELTENIDRYIADIDRESITQLAFAEAFEQLDPEAKSEMAMHIAEQIAAAVMFDLTSDEVAAMAGEAVKAYPHPLLLNNFAALLQDRGRLAEALEIVLLALHQQPEHPVLLTNAANLYIEVDDFDAAEIYATKALQADGEFGPAYQVMTTIHLYNGNSELAAETMIKSAKHVFNDVSIHHFESFLDEVSRLDPRVDEYPLHEALIDELYDIARSHVDTGHVNEGVDTPEGQIRLKPFPTIGSPEHLVRSWAYLDNERDKLEWKKIEAHEEQFAYYGEEDSDSVHEHRFPFEYNLRQIYAYEVMESYYRFKVDQVYARYDQLEREIGDDRYHQFEIFNNEYNAKYDELIKAKADYTVFLQADYDYRSKRYTRLKQDADVLISEVQKAYNEAKQIMEEFWLKSGGILKYIVEKDTFHRLNGKRKYFVYDRVVEPLYDLQDLSADLAAELVSLKQVEHFLNPAEPEEEDGEEIDSGPEVVPDLEEKELDEYPQPGTIHNIQFGLEEGFFGNDASISGNAKGYEASIDTMFGARGWDGSFETNLHRSYTLYDVKATYNTTWFTDTDLVREMLGKTSKSWGKLGLGFVYNDREGKYMTRRGASKKIMDRGTIQVKESGWSLGIVETVSKNEKTMSSRMIGLSSQKNSVKHRFLFMTMSYDIR